ncbi:peptidase MA family metallohydrolase [Tepidiforma flava]|uniref:Peptidase MA family metallohydrolase n=1 Tax=Tepidiforma flava TaxID=3004094 RepID=A0ABY7M5W2_9CHLR|nr:peptidase MA family metallohydrolase [Tepidiforma flava]WBL35368.1 peptidase MA family metallohydrolase [Tepidiforma flava]
MRLAAAAAMTLVALGLLGPGGAPARAAAVIESVSVENGYPRALTFRVTARADTEITDATLHYAIKGRGTRALDKPKDLAPARALTAEVELLVNTGQNYIPVGSEFTYYWEVTTADGQVARSEEQQFLYLPPDRQWQSVANDFMVVYYHGDRETLARAYLNAGADTYERIGRQLYGIELTTLPVKVILFANEAEMNPARPGQGGRFDAAVTTCGTKVTNDILLMIPLACGSPDRTDTLRHELGHILNDVAGQGALAKLPAWMDEGAAVLAQSSPGDYEGAFRVAVRADRLIPFNQMVVPTSNPQLVGVFYGQAYFMVKFLIDREGPGKFAELMRTIKAGTRYDQAIERVYGLTMAQFEDAFRQEHGLAPRSQPTAAPTAAPAQRPQQAGPTAIPTRAPAQSGGDGSGSGGLDRGMLVIFGVALLLALAAVFSWLLAMMLANNRQRGGGGGSAGPGS